MSKILSLFVCLESFFLYSTALGDENTFSVGKNELLGQFLHFGRSIDNQLGQLSNQELKAYHRSLEKFPSLAQCLTPSDKVSNSFDFPKLAYEHINTLQDVEICIFWVSQYLNLPQNLNNWFVSTGFSTQVINYPVGHSKHGQTIVIGQWDKSRHGNSSPFHLGIFTLIFNLTAKSGMRIDVQFNPNNNVQNVSISYSRGP